MALLPGMKSRIMALLSPDTMNPGEPLDAEFRVAGFTGEARKYPLSEKAVEWLAAFNGVPIDKVPITWHYAPNAWMQEWMELLGELYLRDNKLALQCPLMTNAEIISYLER